jgi:RpiR family transcriptional regulator, carbohydrate utilization regulator
VSAATVVRLSRRLGYQGYAALKLALAHEAGRGDQFGHARRTQSAQDSPHAAVMAADAQSIQAAARTIDTDAFTRAVTAIAGARHVMFAGVGVSAALAALAAFRFSALGIRATASTEVLTQHIQASVLAADDACVAISHTGESRDTIEIAEAARRAGATTIGMTSSAGSPLARSVEIALVCADEADRAARELFANPVTLVSVLGALHAGVAARHPRASAPAAAARLITSHQY